MNGEMLHPLMFIKPLDAPTNRARRRRHRAQKAGRWGRKGVQREGNSDFDGRGGSARKGRGGQKEAVPSSSRCLRSSKIQHSFETLLADLNLSESDSDESDDVIPTKRRHQLSHNVKSLNEDWQNPVTTLGFGKTDSERKGYSFLLDDLRLSSDSPSSTSITSSEITGPSDSDSDNTISFEATTQGLTGSLFGESYFWAQESPNPSVNDFKKTSLDEDLTTVFKRFHFFCRDHSAEKAAIILVEKLIRLPYKQCLHFLNALLPQFRKEFFSPDVDSVELFGKIVMTVITHWYAKGLHHICLKFIHFLGRTCHINPLNCHPYVLSTKRSIIFNHIPGNTQVGITCCEIYLACEDYKHAVRCLISSLRPVIEKNEDASLDCLRVLVKRLFETLILKKEMRQLWLLFSTILEMQEDLEHPIDLSVFYDGIMCSLIVSSETCLQKLAFNLFDRVNYWCYFETSGITCRALLTASALLNEPRSRIHKIFSMAVNKGVYPAFNLDEWIVDIYSSMSKIEIQIYLEYCVRAYVEEIWSGQLDKCTTFLTFRICVVSSASVRDYVHPVLPKIKEVDFSLVATIQRLKAVIHHYMKTPIDGFLHYFDSHNLIMFRNDVEKLFKNVLLVKSLNRTSSESCALCS